MNCKVVVEHFREVLHDRVSTDVILTEWLDLKLFVIGSCRHPFTSTSCTDDPWKIVTFAHRKHSKMF